MDLTIGMIKETNRMRYQKVRIKSSFIKETRKSTETHKTYGNQTPAADH